MKIQKLFKLMPIAGALTTAAVIATSCGSASSQPETSYETKKANVVSQFYSDSLKTIDELEKFYSSDVMTKVNAFLAMQAQEKNQTTTAAVKVDFSELKNNDGESGSGTTSSGGTSADPDSPTSSDGESGSVPGSSGDAVPGVDSSEPNPGTPETSAPENHANPSTPVTPSNPGSGDSTRKSQQAAAPGLTAEQREFLTTFTSAESISAHTQKMRDELAKFKNLLERNSQLKYLEATYKLVTNQMNSELQSLLSLVGALRNELTTFYKDIFPKYFLSYSLNQNYLTVLNYLVDVDKLLKTGGKADLTSKKEKWSSFKTKAEKLYSLYQSTYELSLSENIASAQRATNLSSIWNSMQSLNSALQQEYSADILNDAIAENSFSSNISSFFSVSFPDNLVPNSFSALKENQSVAETAQVNATLKSIKDSDLKLYNDTFKGVFDNLKALKTYEFSSTNLLGDFKVRATFYKAGSDAKFEVDATKVNATFNLTSLSETSLVKEVNKTGNYLVKVSMNAFSIPLSILKAFQARNLDLDPVQSLGSGYRFVGLIPFFVRNFDFTSNQNQYTLKLDLDYKFGSQEKFLTENQSNLTEANTLILLSNNFLQQNVDTSNVNLDLYFVVTDSSQISKFDSFLNNQEKTNLNISFSF
ncbi:hypothetical protein K6989_03370 [Mycoplasmopsis synoviae]|uniref:hypothetical protein n=1 Tax=Mycoplasmopsis synoviae TaxID=2109 RepID=UPI001CE12945|nr:hypothetical protein [Mycoplasmopsis synoviae]UBX97394.1 hypothetical protein K6989_03370 [Mycoplasmopsis synoviae]UBX98082.1 hypothetical protein K6987_03590 [Mycoplasmopsis synoviae]